MTRSDIAATIRAAADLGADDLAELCCAIGKAMQPTLARNARACRGDPLGGRTDDLACLTSHVERELDDATARCIATTSQQVALEQAVRCAEAAASLGDDEAEEVAALVAQFAQQRAAIAEVA